MPTNTEIKAHIGDENALLEAIRSSGAVFVAEIAQEDVFFHHPTGRLKLRVSGHRAELIYYEREDRPGPKPSSYRIHPVTEPQSLRELLEAALGLRGVVRKCRRLYRLGQTRLHLDEVEGLGAFLELEVVLEAGQPVDAGQAIALELLDRLGVTREDLVACAYIDLLEQR